MVSEGPLSDLKVVEMSVHRAGPFCGALLADMGAEVIKVERPNVGDPARTQGVGPENRSAYFMANNRNKKSVTLDLKTEAGQEAALELLADADVFLENFGSGVADKLGVGYDEVSEVNDDLVYASIKGYGKTGPLKEKKGLDLILQAEGGIMSVTGPEDGSPVKVGQAIGDLTAGLLSTIGVLSRLHERDRTGEGGQFDVGLYDAIVSLMNEYLTSHSMTGDVPGPQGTSHQFTVPYQMFETADDRIVTGVPSDERWDDFVDMLGREELRDYPTNEDRLENREEVIGIIQEEFAAKPADYWLEQLTEYGFPNGPLNDVEDVVNYEQSEARGLVEDHDDPDWGSCVLPGHPINFPDHDTSIDEPAPELGEHTDSVFAEAVDDDDRLEELRHGGAFGDQE
ncbi:CaiB/BaiF CoA transferase family protein [Haloparvum sp. PAK95]|uniref:CaiB/BaiF CoA transferase family protein n=1 Tax=Haloparvum sp. PAK95 TaxID=3418962 RepID=UPI003D2EA557